MVLSQGVAQREPSTDESNHYSHYHRYHHRYYINYLANPEVFFFFFFGYFFRAGPMEVSRLGVNSEL